MDVAGDSFENMRVATALNRRMRQGLLPVLIVTVALQASHAVAALDYTVKGEHVSGKFGTSESRDRESLAVRLTAGGRVRIWTEVRAVRARSPYGVAHTPLGPAPLSGSQVTDRIRQGGSGGSGRGDQGSGGSAGDSLTGSGWTSGVGDVDLGLAARFLGKPSGLFRLDGEIEFKAPTADEEKGLGTGEWDVRVGLSGERRFWSATAFAGLGWNRLGDPDWIDLRDTVDVFGGLETEPFGRELRGSVWFQGNTEIVPGAGNRMVLGAGLRRGGRMPWSLSAFAGVTDASEDVGISFAMTVGGNGPRSGRRDLVR
jgi:hypothetical protein